MPVTQVVCPNCGHQMPANALETAGEVATLCQSCDEYVFVATNERGKVIGIFIGEEGDAPQATAYDEEGEDEEAGPVLGGRGFFLALLSILLGLVFLGWIASSLYCRPRPQTASTTAVPEDGTTVTPTPTPALPRPVVSIPAVIVLDSFSGVTFETDKATLTAESQQALQDLADTLKGAPPTSVFEIRGHTDNQGSEAYNKQLSYQRAETVRQFLIKHGIPAVQLRAKGFGATVPKDGVTNETEEGRRKNRRIEVVEIKAALPVKK